MKWYSVHPNGPSVSLSQHGPTAANPLLQVCCCGPSQQELSIDCCSSRWTNAGSATLSVYTVAEHTDLLGTMLMQNAASWYISSQKKYALQQVKSEYQRHSLHA